MDKDSIYQTNHLSSVQNPRIKQLVKLRDRSAREETDQFLIEGYRELLRAVDSGFPIDTLFICSDLFLGSNEQFLIERIRQNGAQILSCTKPVFEKISYRDRPDGLIGLAPQRHLTLSDFDKLLIGKDNPFLVVAEAIEKPGNLGTILRSSDAVGLDGLIVCDRCTDIHNPNVVRASTGTLFTVPVAETKGDETLNWLKQNKIAIVAATPSAEKEFTDVDLTGPIAIAVGTEQLGLSKRWMNEADIQVRIPMCGVADSLNVAMATTLLLYEALRQ
ncbi:MAG TPA: RNA methyltransferase, partial [Parachlamydiaceae bacterium]|nr:RNA methyltransferase [Parachlamydiaceae bacterium]